jgi:rhomboid family GlyGly-CTERM serine protease
MKSRVTLPLLLALVALVVRLTPSAPQLLEFNREALAQGEYWRILTGHLVHFNASHFVWDVGALFLLAATLPSLSAGGWLRLLGGAAVVISAGVCFFATQLESYRGLSGVDCALFGAAATGFVVRAFRERDFPLLAVTLLAGFGFLAKSQWELQQGTTLFAQSDGNFVPVPLAHLLGAAWGMISVLIDVSRGRLRDSLSAFPGTAGLMQLQKVERDLPASPRLRRTGRVR